MQYLRYWVLSTQIKQSVLQEWRFNTLKTSPDRCGARPVIQRRWTCNLQSITRDHCRFTSPELLLYISCGDESMLLEISAREGILEGLKSRAGWVHGASDWSDFNDTLYSLLCEPLRNACLPCLVDECCKSGHPTVWGETSLVHVSEISKTSDSARSRFASRDKPSRRRPLDLFCGVGLKD